MYKEAGIKAQPEPDAAESTTGNHSHFNYTYLPNVVTVAETNVMPVSTQLVREGRLDWSYSIWLDGYV
jgi:hypothetical protein